MGPCAMVVLVQGPGVLVAWKEMTSEMGLSLAGTPSRNYGLLHLLVVGREFLRPCLSSFPTSALDHPPFAFVIDNKIARGIHFRAMAQQKECEISRGIFVQIV